MKGILIRTLLSGQSLLPLLQFFIPPIMLFLIITAATPHALKSAFAIRVWTPAAWGSVYAPVLALKRSVLVMPVRRSMNYSFKNPASAGF